MIDGLLVVDEMGFAGRVMYRWFSCWVGCRIVWDVIA